MLADDIATALPELRRQAEARMTDTFAAESYEWTKVDGIDEQTWVPQYETPGRVSGQSGNARDTYTRYVQVGGVDVPEVQGGLHIPLSAALPAVGWEYECIEVGPTTDPALLGRRWRVTNVPTKSAATARRLDVVEVQRASQ